MRAATDIGCSWSRDTGTSRRGSLDSSPRGAARVAGLPVMMDRRADPVVTPFPHVAGHVEHPISIGRERIDWSRPDVPVLCGVVHRVSPSKKFHIEDGDHNQQKSTKEGDPVDRIEHSGTLCERSTSPASRSLIRSAFAAAHSTRRRPTTINHTSRARRTRSWWGPLAKYRSIVSMSLLRRPKRG